MHDSNAATFARAHSFDDQKNDQSQNCLPSYSPDQSEQSCSKRCTNGLGRVIPLDVSDASSK